MRKLQYLSPTSISMFYANRAEFYLNYLCENRPGRLPQTQPMSIGSSFDAHIKSHLYEALFGKNNDPKYELTALFEAQVEPQNRDWAWPNGKHAFEVYKASGAIQDLMLDLQSSLIKPRFEIDVKGVVAGYREGVTRSMPTELGDSIPLLGKPDVFYINKSGAHVILDWKVNGYCSKWGNSPIKGYARLRENGQNKGHHREAMLMMHNGVLINYAHFLETVEESWARQLAIYAWLLGEEIGGDFIAAIDQLSCKPNQFGSPHPDIRIAEHRARISSDYQWKVFAQAQEVWEVVNSNYIFRDLSPEESELKCKSLDGMKGDGSDNDQFFLDATRPGQR